MKSLNSISEIVEHYDNFIIDQWGVMHDGYKGYKYAIDTINFLNKSKTNLFIISNSSKRQKTSYDKLESLGFKKESFINLQTSGEMIWQTLLNKYDANHYKKKCLHIYDDTKEDGLYFRRGLNLIFIENINEADLILACTPFANMDPLDYVPMLDKAVEKKLTMFCANPDFETISQHNDKNIFCMGAISEIYKKMGGQVIIKGKPEKDIYVETTKNFKLNKDRTLAIGDSLFHDIAGANNFNIDSILIKSGIHKNFNSIKNIIKNHKISPTYIMDIFNV